jgi:[acyl-carrier-protein] S-malonyltransferase
MPDGPSRPWPARVTGHYTGSDPRHKIAAAFCPVDLLLPRRCPARLGLGEAFRMKRAFVFPGQGSQVVGMGRSLAEAFPAARHLFDEVDETLSQPLSRLMFEGPESDLTLTENAQPALLAASLAVIRVLEAEGGLVFGRHVAYVAGHSLGEYSALAAASGVTVADAVRLVKLRGRTMQRAVPLGEGAMAALLGLDVEEAQAVVVEAVRSEPDEICAVANDNAPGQVVVSGHHQAIERAIAIARERGARRSIILPVSAPFHSPLMAPAAKVMEKALGKTALRPPLVPLVANLSASAISDPAEVKHLLVGQVTAMVRWRECVQYLKTVEVEEIAEIGTGRVLTGLCRRIDPNLSARAVCTPTEVDAFIKAL